MGNIEKNDYIVIGEEWGKVKRIKDDHGKVLKHATAGIPVRITGLRGSPPSGEEFYVIDGNERKCVDITLHRAEMRRRGSLAERRLGMQDEEFNNRRNKFKLKRVAQAESAEEAKMQGEDNKGSGPRLTLMLQADSTGTLVALEKCFAELVEEYKDKVDVRVLSAGTGDIAVTDIYAASDSDAIIYGFNTKLAKDASALAQQNGVEVLNNKIIYRLEDNLREKLTALVPSVEEEVFAGRAEVLDTFEINGKSRAIKYQINGMKVTSGALKDDHFFRVLRDDETIYDKLQVKTMKIFKEDVKQVMTGNECGIQLVPKDADEGGHQEAEIQGLYGIKLQPGDIVESYVVELNRAKD